MAARTHAVPPGVASDAPEEFGRALGVVSRAYKRVATGALAGFAPGPRGYQALAVIGRIQPRSQAELAVLLGVERTPLTYLLDELEGLGLVSRVADPADRRARILSVTRDGLAVLADLDARLRRAEAALLATIDPGDGDRLRMLLVRLAEEVADPDVQSACLEGE